MFSAIYFPGLDFDLIFYFTFVVCFGRFFFLILLIFGVGLVTLLVWLLQSWDRLYVCLEFISKDELVFSLNLRLFLNNYTFIWFSFTSLFGLLDFIQFAVRLLKLRCNIVDFGFLSLLCFNQFVFRFCRNIGDYSFF